MYKKIILSILPAFLMLFAEAQNKNSEGKPEHNLVLLADSSLRIHESDSVIIKKFYNEALSSGKAYQWLDTLSNKIGGRLSGSKEAAQAVDWGERVFRSINVNVIKQECMVPHWVRGEKEKGNIIPSKTKNVIPVPVCALGGSIATPVEGITAKVVEIKNFDDLEKLGRKNIEGKIVFFNRPMN
ncbi:MAG: hypothetical protein ABI855_13020, partial [Bacteroidota bacterium]